MVCRSRRECICVAHDILPWPPEFLALAGSFPDFPDVGELRNGADIRRESLD
jgi:hypothetical protein